MVRQGWKGLALAGLLGALGLTVGFQEGLGGSGEEREEGEGRREENEGR